MSGPTVVSVENAAPVSDLPVGEGSAAPSSLGIWAFVLAVLGLIGLLPIVGSVLGFVLGRVALRQGESRALRGGRGLALAAVIMALVTLVVIAIGIAAYALVVAFLEL